MPQDLQNSSEMGSPCIKDTVSSAGGGPSMHQPGVCKGSLCLSLSDLAPSSLAWHRAGVGCLCSSWPPMLMNLAPVLLEVAGPLRSPQAKPDCRDRPYRVPLERPVLKIRVSTRRPAGGGGQNVPRPGTQGQLDIPAALEPALPVPGRARS